LALADELHFGRTAERLRISQARVSQAIKLQERRLGTKLFERTSRNVALTHIGARLRDDLRVHYDGIQTAFARARDAAAGVTGTLRLGVMGAVGYLSRDLIDGFRRRYADCVVQVREIHFSDPLGPLRAGQVDVALMWRPIREPGLTEGPVVLIEGRVLAVAAGHELADHTSVSLEDLGDRVVIDPGPLAPGGGYAQRPGDRGAGRRRVQRAGDPARRLRGRSRSGHVTLAAVTERLGRASRSDIRAAAIVIPFLILFVLLAVASPPFLTTTNLLNILDLVRPKPLPARALPNQFVLPGRENARVVVVRHVSPSINWADHSAA
jgi:DNA-binding transcriptional LysR family regulator